MRRIQFFGAPGAGKSVLAHEFFVHCKKLSRNCEIVNELAREWAYIDRPIQSMDQVYLFASQMNREDTLLSRSKVQFVVCDSPILLNAFYTVKQNDIFWPSLDHLCRVFDQKYEVINFFCPNNDNYAFQNEGRHHNKEETEALSTDIYDFVSSFYGVDNLHVVPEESRLQFIIDKMTGLLW